MEEFETRSFVVVLDDDDMVDAMQDALDELEAGVTATDDDGVAWRPSVSVRCARRGEAAGTYEDRGGDLQILGHTIPTPDELHHLLNRAWEQANS